MPVTPYHLGPGIVIKAVLRSSFSLLVFAWSQVLIDLQPLIVLITGRGQLHGFTHTYVGALAIGVAAAVTCRPLCELAQSLLVPARRRIEISWSVAFTSALIGTISHVAIDSVTHLDVHPYAPFSDASGPLGSAMWFDLRPAMIWLAVVGALAYALVTVVRSRPGKRIDADKPAV